MQHPDRLIKKTVTLGVYVAFWTLIPAAAAVAASSADDGGGPTDTFFYQFFVAGGAIVWFVLLPMSVATIYLAIDLAFAIRRKRLLGAAVPGEILAIAHSVVPGQLPARLAGREDLISRTLLRTLSKSRRLQADIKHLQHIAAESLQEQGLHLLRKVEWCNIIGNVAPMVGLFGTVFGMIQAFNILGIAGGQPPHDQLAAKISIALVTTFWGLLIAIPALAIHGIFRTRVEALISEAAVEIEDLLFQIPLASANADPSPDADLAAERVEERRTVRRDPPQRQRSGVTGESEY